MSTIDKLNNDASMLDMKNTLQQLNEYQASTNNRLYTVLQNQNIEATTDMTLNELISATDEGFSNIISNKNTEIANKNTKIEELETQVADLNSQLAGKVTPAGDAVAGDVLSGKTFINSTGQTITGTITNRGGAKTVTPGTSNQTIYSGYYSGNITVSGDTDLKAANIKSGVNIFGVTGSYTGTSSTPTYLSVNRSISAYSGKQDATDSISISASKTPSIIILSGTLTYYSYYYDTETFIGVNLCYVPSASTQPTRPDFEIYDFEYDDLAYAWCEITSCTASTVSYKLRDVNTMSNNDDFTLTIKHVYYV